MKILAIWCLASLVVTAVHYLVKRRRAPRRRPEYFLVKGQTISAPIDVARCLICAGCQVVFDLTDDCPRCGSTVSVWPLWRWLNREGIAISNISRTTG